MLQVFVADGTHGQEGGQEAHAGTAGAHGDAAGARVPGQHAHRLIKLQSAELLGVRRADGRAQLPVGRGDRGARERGHVRAERPVRVRAEAARDARPRAPHVPAVRPHPGVPERAEPDMLHGVRGLGPVPVAGHHMRPAGQRVRGNGDDRIAHRQREDALPDGVLQLDEPRVERDVHVPRAIRRARVRPVRGDGRGHQSHARAARGAAQVHAQRVPARGHAVLAQPAAAARLAVRVHAVHGRPDRRPLGPRPGQGDARAVRGRRRHGPLRAGGQAQGVRRDGVRCVRREHVRYVHGDAGHHSHGRHQAGDPKAQRDRR